MNFLFKKDKEVSRDSMYYLEGIYTHNRYVLEEIYRVFGDRVLKMVKNNNGTVDDAKDIIQDVLIALLRQKEKGLKITTSFSTFFLLIAKRRWINHINSKYADHKTVHNFDEDSQPILMIHDDVDKIDDYSLRMELVNEKLKILDQQCRDIITMSWETDERGKYQHLDQIADALDLNHSYLRRKIGECKSRLIDLVQKDRRYVDFKN